ncbi:MAG: PEGA domain-containing protein [Terriglobales bacterium]
MLVRSLNDFSGAYEEFKRLTASLPPNPRLPAAPASGTLSLSAEPANVQVYVDDVFKGMTSAEGRLVVEGLTPGAHRVRINLIGYAESARTVELKPGETSTVEAKLEPAGPRPLALAEIEEALTNGLPPKGITKLVNQYGVDFALTKEVEQRLREKGADADLLLAIATNKK